MTPEEFLRRMDNGERFSEEELESIIWGGIDDTNSSIDFYQADEIEGASGRWQKLMTKVLCFGDRFFAIDYEQGLTEYQENSYEYQPYEVTKKEIMVVQTKWITVQPKVEDEKHV